jgi:hypothetical protein
MADADTAEFEPSAAVLELARVMTYDEIATHCDTDKSNVARWAAGRHLPSHGRWLLLEALWREQKQKLTKNNA